MNNFRARISKKLIKLAENDIDKMLKFQKRKKSKPSPIFNNFDENFSKKLESNKNYIENINKSIHNTKK